MRRLYLKCGMVEAGNKIRRTVGTARRTQAVRMVRASLSLLAAVAGDYYVYGM